MSLSIRNPVRTIRGGELVDSRLSGINVDTMIQSGCGRLYAVTRLTTASGAGVVWYDGAVATSGGPFASSGHKVLAVLLQPVIPTVSGLQGTQFSPYGIPVPVEMPFQSGLIVAPIGSGTPAFNASYSVEPAF